MQIRAPSGDTHCARAPVVALGHIPFIVFPSDRALALLVPTLASPQLPCCPRPRCRLNTYFLYCTVPYTKDVAIGHLITFHYDHILSAIRTAVICQPYAWSHCNQRSLLLYAAQYTGKKYRCSRWGLHRYVVRYLHCKHPLPFHFPIRSRGPNASCWSI